jgi:hypothetical protein
MKKLSLLSFALIILISSISVISGPGCANIIPPEGGLRDSIPPMLVKASPADSSKNFEGNHITLTFDEFVQLQNPRENLIVSPVPKIDPQVESKLKTVTIRLKDTLEPNTTYSLNFGNAIRDNNEGNIAKNFTYLFSTGPAFDSLTLSGKVLLAENGKVDTTLIVMLHKNGEDSAVANERPRYLTRIDSLGNFTFHNLPPGTFYIYALQDEGASHRYLSEKQLFAFADTSVTIPTNNKPVILYAYAEGKTASRSLPKINARAKTGGGNADKRLKLQTNLATGQLDLLSDLTISFEQPWKKLDTALIHFSSDTSFTPVSDYKILTDTSKKKFSIQYVWKENTRYNIIVEKDFAEDTLGRALLKSDTISFKTKKLSDYGSLRIRFKNFDLSVNPVLQFVRDNNIVKAFPLTSAEINQRIFPPGEYELRILYDRNKNGKWDPGEFFGKHLQPEIVKPIISRRKISVKPNWDNDFDIAL